MELTKKELAKLGWKSNKEREDAIKSISQNLSKYIMDTSPSFRLTDER